MVCPCLHFLPPPPPLQEGNEEEALAAAELLSLVERVGELLVGRLGEGDGDGGGEDPRRGEDVEGERGIHAALQIGSQDNRVNAQELILGMEVQGATRQDVSQEKETKQQLS